MENQSNQIIIKIVFTGKTSVGKTSLLVRQTTNEFNKQWLATIGVDFKIKTYRVGNINVKAQIWDTAGQQRFRSIQRPYYKGAQAVLLCFDLNVGNSLKDLESQLAEIRGLDINTCKVYLIGCKSDLEPKVFTDEILMFANQHQCNYFQTSSKENQGVNECFQAIVRQCAQNKLEEMAFSKIPVGKQLVEKSEPEGFKKRCC